MVFWSSSIGPPVAIVCMSNIIFATMVAMVLPTIRILPPLACRLEVKPKDGKVRPEARIERCHSPSQLVWWQPLSAHRLNYFGGCTQSVFN